VAALEHVAWLLGEQARRGSPENPDYLSLQGQILAEESKIQVLLGHEAEGRKTLEEAEEKMGQAVKLDPDRIADRVKLDQLKSRLAQPGR
jgi:hypothetical protein